MPATKHSAAFNTLDWSIGRLLKSRSGNDSEILELVGALTSRALRQGHICLDVNRLSSSDLSPDKGLSPSDLIDYLQSHPSVGNKKETTLPLILSDTGKLYFHRYWHYERQLIESIEARLTDKPPSTEEATPHIKKLLSNLGRDQQKAVHLATRSQLSLISGGPGTGKTTTVLYILAALQETHQGIPLKVALAAPTGKAAQRIQESLASSLESFSSQNENHADLSPETSTLHRLLGYQRNSIEFQHTRDNPLPYDVVVVDEASMLDLLMFNKLMNALRPETRLILLGDSHQLASVEAGSIFGDLLIGSRTHSALKEHSIELTENFRFGNDSALYQACEYIKTGDNENALRQFSHTDQLSIQDHPGMSRLPAALEKSVGDHFTGLTQLTDPHLALRSMSEFCLLTPIRNGPYGVHGLNGTIESIVRSRLGQPTNQKHFTGLPILITANSYSQGLFNGDLGIIMQDSEDSNSLFAYFPDDDQGVKRYPLSALPAFESAYALTVHKSQGSEYKKILFLVPPIDSPVLSRELLYTAISRSRETAEVWGDEESLTRAINQQTQRISGILDHFSE